MSKASLEAEPLRPHEQQGGLLTTHNDGVVPIQVTLFERYREHDDPPFAVFVGRLRGRAARELPPPVAHAAMHIRLHLGILRRMLYWVHQQLLCLTLLTSCCDLQRMSSPNLKSVHIFAHHSLVVNILLHEQL
jgi:hypothetical protein